MYNNIKMSKSKTNKSSTKDDNTAVDKVAADSLTLKDDFDDTSDFDAPVKSGRGRKKKTPVVESSDEESEVDEGSDGDDRDEEESTKGSGGSGGGGRGKYKVEAIDSFDDMDLKENLLRGIYAYGFDKPSVIQQKGIVPLAKGYDLIAQSQSGTGKTGTFSIGTLQKISVEDERTQALVLAPTRELALQIGKVMTALSSYMGVKVQSCVGGIRTKERYGRYNVIKAQVVVGTPGRIYHYLRNGAISCDALQLVVLDEADKMLAREFSDQIRDIISGVSKTAQIVLFSATMPREMLDMTNKFMNHPVRVLVPKDELTLDGIKQFYVSVNKDEHKFNIICSMFDTISVTQCIIYCNRSNKVEMLTRELTDRDFCVSCLYGQMEQEERNKILDSFRSGSTRILITTDVLARGIDVQQVSLVINFDLPYEKETYIHRIGRSGRFGRKGIAINMVTPYDHEQLKTITEYYETQIDEMPANIAELIN